MREAEIPESMREMAEEKRETLVDAASLFSDELTEAALEGEVPEALLIEAVRTGALTRGLTPVFFGSAYKNKGVQPLLDGVSRFLPNPADIEHEALDPEQDETPVSLSTDPEKPMVALAFKLEDGPYGQLTYVRAYQGTLSKGSAVVNVRTGKKVKIGRVVRMHADQMEEIESVPAGSIGALFGIDCASGDTFTDPGFPVSMTSMHVPDPVISLSITPVDNKSEQNMGKALNRFTKEDPTFCVNTSEETGETIISGMGELHLEVYVERMLREYGARVETGTPRVAYRETITKRATFDYTHKKQTGGAGQYGRVAGYIEPVEAEFEFENQVTGGAIPTQYIPACEKGFQRCLNRGPAMEYPVTGVRVVLQDGNAHSVDSSEMAFQAAAVGAFKQVYPKAAPVILEPVMKVVVETPPEFQGTVMGSLNQRRGMIVGSTDEGAVCIVESEVPLSEMFGYTTVLRSLTQGKAQFTMEFSAYRPVPKSVAEELAKKRAAEKKNVA